MRPPSRPSHGAGFVHRDVKPEHVILDPALGLARVGLVDLGLAQAAGDPRTLTAGAVVGTPGRLPPSSCGPRRRAPRPAGTCSPSAACSPSAPQAPRLADRDPRGVLARTLAGAAALEGVAPPLASVLRAALAPRASERPADAAALGAVGGPPAELSARASAPRHLAVVLAHPTDAALGATTPAMTAESSVSDAVREVLPRGAAARTLGDGSLVVWMAAHRVDADHAARALQSAAFTPIGAGRPRSATATRRDRGPAAPRSTARSRSAPRRARGEVSTDPVTALLAAERFTLEPRGACFVLRAAGRVA